MTTSQSVPREGFVAVTNAALYWRAIGQGRPIIVLHGGPDFDHVYLLPEMDRFADLFHLIYYDQRGRGMSGQDVQPEDVSIHSEIEDLDAVRKFFDLDSVALLGHSWGAVLAMQYTVRHPHRVSHLILMNPAPASHQDLLLFRDERRKTAGGDLAQLQALRATDRYKQGALDADAEYYRIHFKATVRQEHQLETILGRLRLNLTPEGVRKARAIEDRLYDQTWLLPGYNLLIHFPRLPTPTLVIHGEHDFVPLACAAHIAQAIPGAHLADLTQCGHFSYLECPEDLRREVIAFFGTDDRPDSHPGAA